MRIHDYDRAENAVRIGLVLVIAAGILNALSLYLIPGNTLIDLVGVLCAAASLAVAYFGDSFVFELRESTYDHIAQVCVCACGMSYAAWLFSFIA